MKGFESKEHELKFWSFLKKKIVPTKFGYTGEASFTHDLLASQDFYYSQMGDPVLELHALKNHIRSDSCPSQLCEIGPGNGIRSTKFLELLKKSGYRINRYIGLDFSGKLLEIGMTYIQKHFPGLDFHSMQWDVEENTTQTIINWSNGEPALLVLSGFTLCGVQDPLEVLLNIHGSCNFKDILILGVGLRYGFDQDSLPSYYRSELFVDAILKPLSMAGIKIKKDGELDVQFSRSKKAIIANFVFERELMLEYEGEQITFKNGDAVQCFITKRFNDKEIEELLSKSGWKLETVYYNNEKSKGIYLATRGR